MCTQHCAVSLQIPFIHRQLYYLLQETMWSSSDDDNFLPENPNLRLNSLTASQSLAGHSQQSRASQRPQKKSSGSRFASPYSSCSRSSQKNARSRPKVSVSVSKMDKRHSGQVSSQGIQPLKKNMNLNFKPFLVGI